MKHAKTKVAIGLDRDDRALERNRLNAVLRQCVHHSRKLVEQHSVILTCPLEVHGESIEDVLGHRVGRDASQRMPGQPGQPMVDRLAREERPVDALREHLPDRGFVLRTRTNPGASQKKPQLKRHGFPSPAVPRFQPRLFAPLPKSQASNAA